MRSLSISLKSTKQEKNHITESIRASLARETLKKMVDTIVEIGDGFSLVSEKQGTTSAGRYYGRYFIDIGNENLYMFLDYYSRESGTGGGNIPFRVGMCNKSDVDTESYTYSLFFGNVSILENNEYIDSKYYYWGEVNATFCYMVDASGKLSAFFPLDLIPKSFVIFDMDIFNIKYMIAVDPTAQGYNGLFFNNSSKQYKIDNTIKKFSKQNYVLKENISILDSDVISLSKNFVKIYNQTLSTDTNLSGTIIMADGVKYRKMGHAYWLPDYD